VCGYNPFQFVVLARTEQDARRRLLATVVEAGGYHEFQGCYAQSVKDIVENGDRIRYCVDTDNWVDSKDFEDFVLKVRLKIKILFLCSSRAALTVKLKLNFYFV